MKKKLVAQGLSGGLSGLAAEQLLSLQQLDRSTASHYHGQISGSGSGYGGGGGYAPQYIYATEPEECTESINPFLAAGVLAGLAAATYVIFNYLTSNGRKRALSSMGFGRDGFLDELASIVTVGSVASPVLDCLVVLVNPWSSLRLMRSSSPKQRDLLKQSHINYIIQYIHSLNSQVQYYSPHHSPLLLRAMLASLL